MADDGLKITNDDVKATEKAALFKLLSTLVTFAVGAALAMVANWLGVRPPETITVPVVVQAAPAVEGGLMCESRPRMLGFRAKLHAEIDRRAALPENSVWYINAEKAKEAHDFVGKLGDGHLLDLLIKYGPDIAAVVIKILLMLAML